MMLQSEEEQPESQEGYSETLDGKVDKEQPVRHGFWKSWKMSFKEGKISMDHLLGLFILVCVIFSCLIGGCDLFY